MECSGTVPQMPAQRVAAARASQQSTGPAEVTLPGYVLLGKMGEGGMGVVYKARHVALNRLVAVKTLRDSMAVSPIIRARLLAETEAVARLPHPGIAPVHEVGELPDGRPYFAMKLVEGHTLAELLEQRPSPQHDLPRFLAVFEQVCQAVAYAHSKGVLHRDLKPSNVMVGEFGEVQVMDWGLTKAFVRPSLERERQDPERPVAGAPGSDQTALGARMGTLAYMPPEQAAGRAGAVGPHSDAFGLGAVLCEVLTGKPPYTGASAGEVQMRALRADLTIAFARLDRCGADPDLVALAKCCLAADPASRPRDGRAVAEAVASIWVGCRIGCARPRSIARRPRRGRRRRFAPARRPRRGRRRSGGRGG
jgi:serine/threonine-protein kinase